MNNLFKKIIYYSNKLWTYICWIDVYYLYFLKAKIGCQYPCSIECLKRTWRGGRTNSVTPRHATRIAVQLTQRGPSSNNSSSQSGRNNPSQNAETSFIAVSAVSPTNHRVQGVVAETSVQSLVTPGRCLVLNDAPPDYEESMQLSSPTGYNETDFPPAYKDD